MKYQKEIITAIVLVIVAVSTRLMPHMWNVTAAGAIAIASGMYLRGKSSIFVPLIAMLVSDILIGFYNPLVMISVYASIALTVVIAREVKKQGDLAFAPQSIKGFVAKTLIASTAGTMLFYVVTNWAVWAFSGMYTLTFGGLLQSYIAALPFLRNSFFGDLFFSFIVCGAVAASYAFLSLAQRQGIEVGVKTNI